ncbi:AAA family ATPase [Biscogniauxia marginata]|nr:AAA family ATPase [Biscogniauxia marginata]
MGEREQKLSKVVSLEERLRQLEDRYSELDKRYKDLQYDKKSDAGDKQQEDKSEVGDRNEESTGRFRVLINKYDPRSGERRDYKPDESDTVNKVEASSTLAWQLRKFTGPDGDDESEVEIFGPELKALLAKALHHHPDHWFIGNTVTLNSPFEPLVLNWEILNEETQKTEGEEDEKIGRSDLKDLMDTLQQGSGDSRLDDYFKNKESFKANRSITFPNLWTLFPPGMLVHSRPFMKQHQIFIVMECDRTWPRYSPRSRTYETWTLSCFMYDWTGQKFIRRLVSLEIEHFEGPRPIGTLPIQPLESIENKDDIQKELLRRGKTFREYCILPSDKRLFKYEGKAIYDKSGIRGVVGDSEKDEDERTYWQPATNKSSTELSYSNVNSDVMVDFDSYYKYGQPWSSIGKLAVNDEDGECDCTDCRKNEALQESYRTRYDDKTGDESEEWEDLQFMLCAPRVLGYVLRDKTWAQLDVTKIVPIAIEGADDAFMNKLKLAGEENGKKTKELLMALVKNHGISEDSNWDRGYQLKDIVADKGQGLVILLYGPPGVGKTSTAQTIAVAVGKPLFPVGVADVGTSAKKVEKNLDKIFDLATTWKAVLLIDEADVFLQSRARGELGPTTERNALVSVFLRVLEYYQGILILTTNQIAQFDVAVQSRIHIAIRYDSLKPDQTLAIFNTFMDQCERNKLVTMSEKPAIDKWAKGQLTRKNFDGRQIRNIITSAMGLARAANRQMELNDLIDVVDIMETFKTDLAYQMMQYEDSQRGRLK